MKVKEVFEIWTQSIWPFSSKKLVLVTDREQDVSDWFANGGLIGRWTADVLVRRPEIPQAKLVKDKSKEIDYILNQLCKEVDSVQSRLSEIHCRLNRRTQFKLVG